MLAIIDYEMGNLRSVQKGFERVGQAATITGDPDVLRTADKVVLPGVGAFEDAIAALRRRNLVEPIREYIASGRPFFGVCMGQQALLSVSEEGGAHECLDIIEGRVTKLPPGQKIPHMGWNTVRQLAPHPIFEGIPDESHFYFVNSYYVAPAEEELTLCAAEYGLRFTAMIQRDNVFATQFHVEKSGPLGLQILKNFVAI